MKPEKRQLLHDALDEQRDTRRAATLLAGGTILRRRRWRRAAFRGVGVIALLAVAAISLHYSITPHPQNPSAQAKSSVAPSPAPTALAVESLTDAQLLGLFTNTPVGLVTLENGKKRLIFPRDGDQERYVKRL